MMKIKAIINLLIASLYFIFSNCMAENDFQIRTQKNQTFSEIIATNKSPYKVSVQLSLIESNNIQSDHNWPFIVVIAPNTSTTLASLYPLDPLKTWTFNYKFKHFIGDYTEEHSSNSLYSLPFEEGKSFKVSQAFGDTLTTHDNERDRYAVDITMPTHTQILAARSGTVLATEAMFNDGGADEIYRSSANYIKILHDDGTTASYVHLEHNGVLVDKGQWVDEGDLIGYSGSTGFSSGPHLHFGVTGLSKINNELTEISIPFQFYVGDPPVTFSPRKNQWIKSVYNEPVELYDHQLAGQNLENPSVENIPKINEQDSNIQNLDKNESIFGETVINLFYALSFIVVLFLAFLLFYEPSRKRQKSFNDYN